MIGILDPILLQTLSVVAEEASFSRAGERIGLTQQAISAQIKRLESIAGQRLIDRQRPDVRVTTAGEALIAYGRLLSETAQRIRRQFSAVPIVGSVRVGVLEGFASSGLVAVLAGLREAQPNIDVLVEVGETDGLLARMENGRLDVVLGGQRPGQGHGRTVRVGEMRWYGDATPFADPGKPVRLVAQPAPSLPRDLAIEALVRAGRSYAVMFESSSRASLRAAVMAGLGVTAFHASFQDEVGDPEPATLPPLESVEFFLRTGRGGDEAAALVAELIADSINALFDQRTV